MVPQDRIGCLLRHATFNLADDNKTVYDDSIVVLEIESSQIRYTIQIEDTEKRAIIGVLIRCVDARPPISCSLLISNTYS